MPDKAPSRDAVLRLRALLAEARRRREAVLATTNVYRLVDDAADGVPGFVVDVYAEWAVLSASDDRDENAVHAIAEALVAEGIRGVYLKRRPRSDLRREDPGALSPHEPISGASAPEPLVVEENGIRFGVELGAGLSTGLFTDQRDNRDRVRAEAAGASVLNLFAYTCSFTVAAALGGARETESVDLSQRALARGNDNLVRNGVSGSAHRLLKSDVVSYLARAVRRGTRFDLVVLDRPSFGTRTRGTFSVERDYALLASQSLSLLEPGGRLLAVTNHRKTTSAQFALVLRSAARTAGREIKTLTELPTPVDHSHRLGGEPPTKSALVMV